MSDEFDPWEDPEPTDYGETNPRVVRRTRSMHLLRQVDGPGAPRDYPLEASSVILGRASNAGIRINSSDVSRHHCKLTRRFDDFLLEDLESRNGVLLNGVRVNSAALRDQDTVQVGSALFIYLAGE